MSFWHYFITTFSNESSNKDIPDYIAGSFDRSGILDMAKARAFYLIPFYSKFSKERPHRAPRVSETSAKGAWRLYLPFGNVTSQKKHPWFWILFIFIHIVVSGLFFTLLCRFWNLAGGKNSSKYDHIKLSPFFHPLTVRLAQKLNLSSDFDWFYQFSPSRGHFWPFLAIFGCFWAPLSPRVSETSV